MLLLIGMVALGVMAHIVWKKSSHNLTGGKVVSFRVYIFILCHFALTRAVFR